MKKVETKREYEKRIVSEMIDLYCFNNHHTKQKLCQQCLELKNYAIEKTNHCPFMETKTFCSNCKVHCYKPEMRERIREVMRYSGPRMIFTHPITAIKHVYLTKKERRGNP